MSRQRGHPHTLFTPQARYLVLRRCPMPQMVTRAIPPNSRTHTAIGTKDRRTYKAARIRKIRAALNSRVVLTLNA